MTTSDMPAEQRPDARSSRRKRIWIIAVSIIGLMFLIQDALGWINGGGIFSLVSALHAADAKLPAIDIDDASLRSPMIDALCLAVLGICYGFDLDLAKRWLSLIVIISIMGGGFILDGIYGERINTMLMVSRGYTRCSSLDHGAGNGKSRVWFNRYELRAGDCPRP